VLCGAGLLLLLGRRLSWLWVVPSFCCLSVLVLSVLFLSLLAIGVRRSGPGVSRFPIARPLCWASCRLVSRGASAAAGGSGTRGVAWGCLCSPGATACLLDPAFRVPVGPMGGVFPAYFSCGTVPSSLVSGLGAPSRLAVHAAGVGRCCVGGGGVALRVAPPCFLGLWWGPGFLFRGPAVDGVFLVLWGSFGGVGGGCGGSSFSGELGFCGVVGGALFRSSSKPSPNCGHLSFCLFFYLGDCLRTEVPSGPP